VSQEDLAHQVSFEEPPPIWAKPNIRWTRWKPSDYNFSGPETIVQPNSSLWLFQTRRKVRWFV